MGLCASEKRAHRETQRRDDRHAHAGRCAARIVEQIADRASERRALLGVPALEDVGLQAAEARHDRDIFNTRGGLQRLANQLEIVRLEPARRAAVEVIGNRNAIGDGQLFVVKGGELGAHLLAAPGQHRRSPSSTRSAWRARVSLDLTVPTGSPSENAISSYFNPSTSRNTSAVRCSNGRF